jgi:hypothetical protein
MRLSLMGSQPNSLLPLILRYKTQHNGFCDRGVEYITLLFDDDVHFFFC